LRDDKQQVREAAAEALKRIDPQGMQQRDKWSDLVRQRPKLELWLRRITVYQDGIVYKATLVNHTKVPIRVRPTALPLRLRGIAFTDDQQHAWGVPGLESHHYFGPDTVKNTIIIGPGKAAKLVLVDDLESPRIVPKAQKKGVLTTLPPSALSFGFTWGMSVDQADLAADLLDVQFVGRGSVEVRWINEQLSPNAAPRFEEACKGDSVD